MKSNCIRIFQTGLPYADGAYVRGAGNAIETATASIVVTGTGAGQQGCGGFTLCGGNCIAAHSESVPPLARLKAPALTGGAPMYRMAPRKGTAETIAGIGGCRTQGYCRFQVKTAAIGLKPASSMRRMHPGWARHRISNAPARRRPHSEPPNDTPGLLLAENIPARGSRTLNKDRPT
ncbi:hypothetical protein [Leisingera sp. NJS204]|uniref:hypothetical protein n=1 Tax=Leisingera sp. NJS204 TaxID=2508307 RepID=UPI0010128E91|nr:hypothetical protein [Leisingera sp. NJS204]QAX28713.1 hypothetical protein ETW24_04575 [Leisingera sp. NJS204]